MAVSTATPPARRPDLDAEELRTEANRLHRALFGGDAPAEIQDQYERALARFRLAAFPAFDLAPLIAGGVDLEALEIALRRVNAVNALTQRFQVLCYLVEARPEYVGRFMTEESRFSRGVVSLGVHSVRSVYKWIKGRCLLRIHHVR